MYTLSTQDPLAGPVPRFCTVQDTEIAFRAKAWRPGGEIGARRLLDEVVEARTEDPGIRAQHVEQADDDRVAVEDTGPGIEDRAGSGKLIGAIELPALFLAQRTGLQATVPMETIGDPELQRWFVRTRGGVGLRIVGLREARRELENAQRMRPDAQLLLFELDPALSRDLARQFADDPRVRVINANAATIRSELAQRGIAYCDYIISGIPFSILEIEKKRDLLRQTHDALAPGGAFIIYQVTNELRQHATDFAPESESEYFLQNIPPMFITVFRKAGELNGNGAIDPDESRFSANYAR